jgi:hypothetical protein
MRTTILGWLTMATGLIAAAFFAGCQASHTVAVSAMSPESQRVSQALEAWPEAPVGAPGLKRPFFTTIHLAGKRVTASGVLEYHSARDFRITAATELGVILFDARMNWAGVTVLRQMPGLDKLIVDSVVRDLSKAFELPASLDGLGQQGNVLLLSHTDAESNHYTWVFDPSSGRLRETAVKLGAFDTLLVEYPRYNAHGWPEEMTLTRKARFYMINLTFNDGSIVRRP